MSGRFFVIEGIEGSGKSTLARGLAEQFSNEGESVLLTKEPGGTALGQHLREILLSREEPIHSEAELLLFLADRAQHVRELLLPSLQAGMTIICDRYFYSTLAYQGFGRGMDLGVLRQLISFATGGLLPERVFLVDLPVEVALERAHRRKAVDASSWNRFEAEELSFHERIRQGFLSLQREDSKRIVLLDGTLPPEKVLAGGLQSIRSSKD